jgi:hypothetical protein
MVPLPAAAAGGSRNILSKFKKSTTLSSSKMSPGGGTGHCSSTSQIRSLLSIRKGDKQGGPGASKFRTKNMSQAFKSRVSPMQKQLEQDTKEIFEWI